ncbi:MAG: 4-(cytidine 5'-diphospho)-2-C-methyl-D-erythritol kinase [Flavobacteriales bacterium]|nr:4-(cytidine 5'-diphospho)-2-C-methyl-D-erythritol kinase [Flavobacteriales bacterium]
MLVFPNAKINLGLNVVSKRADGFHDIESVFVPVPLCDALEAVVDRTLEDGRLVYTRSGLTIPGDPEKDLCSRAHSMIASRTTVPGVRMHLHKIIPMGAGLGGGSSDGTRTLMLLDELFDLKTPEADLLRMATELGSDCPFFIGDSAMLATGRGETLMPLELDLSGLYVALVHPNVHIGTAEVYANTVPTGRSVDLVSLVARSRIAMWQEDVKNTMEPYVSKEHPVIGIVKRELLSQGAIYAAMSGSGSSVFGIFPERPADITLPNGLVAQVFTL